LRVRVKTLTASGGKHKREKTTVKSPRERERKGSGREIKAPGSQRKQEHIVCAGGSMRKRKKRRKAVMSQKAMKGIATKRT